MNRLSVYTILFCWIVSTWMGISPATATELFLNPIRNTPASGQENNTSFVEVPIKLDQAQNLAGIKLILTYAKNRLEFQKASKTKATSSLMHIVNSKKPGRLIIVMAGAMGISGTDITLLNIRFRVKQKNDTDLNTSVKIISAELMDAKLKPVEVTIRATKSPPTP